MANPELNQPTMQGKICLVTGATSGIGFVASRELSRLGAHVVMVGRNSAKCEAAVQEIRRQTGNTQTETLLADLSSQQQIRQLVRKFHERHSRLDALINNAGGLWLDRELTVDGLEMTFAVNHLAYFLLTRLLLDTLQQSGAARIVNVASEAHRKTTMNFDDPMGERSYHGWRAYCQSKLTNLLFTYELARQLQGTTVTANAMHPGWVATGFAGNNGWKGRLWQAVAHCFAISAEKGARTIVYLAATSDAANAQGRYFVKERPVASSSASYDVVAAQRLWRLSLDCIR